MINIQNKIDCCGCLACYNVCPKKCISMEGDEEGFWYPCVDTALCVDCGVCESVCPIIKSAEMPSERKITAYAAYTKDEKIREESSSGGLFTEIASYVINNGGVVFGAAFTESLEVKHTYAESIEGLEAFRGSKYLQSKIGDAYSEAETFLKQGRHVLFTGTPCQIEGLLSFLKKPYDGLITQDIICHGVPSPMVWKRYIEHREAVAASETRRTFFRHKKYGWKTFSVRFIFKNRTEYVGPLYKDPYMRGFLADLCLRPSCYDCHFKCKERKSDFTLADFWGIQNVCPEMDDDKGTSLVFVNSEKAARIFDEIKNRVVYKETDLDTAVVYNPAMIRSASKPQNREAFLKDIVNEDFDKTVNKYCKMSFFRRVYRKLRGIAKRILKR